MRLLPTPSRAPVDVLVFVACLALVGAATALLLASTRTRDELRFSNAISSAEDRVVSRLETYVAMLRAGAATFSAGGELTVDQFRTYVARLELARRYPGIQGIGFSRRLRPGEREAFEARMRAEGHPEFHVWPDTPRDELHTIAMLEPLDRRNAAAIGYDMFSEEVRREAMSRARDHGVPAMTGPVTLVQEIDPEKQLGFLIYVPVYEGGEVPPPGQERREKLLGFVYAPFRVNDLFAGIFGGEHLPRVAFTVNDVPLRRSLYRSTSDSAYPAAPRWRATHAIDVAGRRWELEYESLPEFERASARPYVWLTLAFGVLLSVGVFGLLSMRASAHAQSERSAAELRAALEQGRLHQERLAEEKHTSETLRRVGALVAGELDADRLVQLITDEGTRSCGAKFGAFFHNEDDGKGGSYQMYSLSGAPREAFSRFPHPRATAVFGPTFRGERVVRFDDVRKAPEYGKNAPFHGMPEGHLQVASYLAVPVVSRAGKVLGGLFFGHPEPKQFTAAHEHLAVGIAASAAVALETARLYRALQAADRRKDEFLAMLAHELRNPMAPTTLAVQLLRKKISTGAAPARELDIVERQLGQLQHLVDDLLDVSRITRGKIDLRVERCDLRASVKHAVAAQRLAADQRGHAVKLELPDAPLWVDGDPLRLEQVIANLLNNSVKYTDPGGHIEVRAWSHAGAAWLSVRDDGSGIAPEVLPHVFELFAQGDRSLDRAQGGLGIGLTLVQKLVELQGGTVSAASEGIGKGTTVTFSLPLRDAPAEASTPAAAPALPKPAPSAAAARVLVVDDNVDAAQMLEEIVAELGFDVASANDAQTALALARAQSPNVVFLDIGLPQMSGYDVCRALRPELPKTVFVALTGYGQRRDRELSQEAGFDHHVVKPAKLEEIEKILAAVAARQPRTT